MKIPVDKLKAMVQGVRETQQLEYSCDDVYRLLDEFAEAVANGKDAAALMPLVQQHLEMCPDCREEFEALRRVIAATRSEA